MNNRFDRNERFFGAEGQKKLNNSKVVLVGCGGNGTHVAQQLAHLGIAELYAVDKELLDETNLNRYIGSRHNDPADFPIKTKIIERTVNAIDSNIIIHPIQNTFLSYEAFDAIKKSDYVFGCLDDDTARFILNELCLAYKKPYIDIATDIFPGKPTLYGGRVFINWNGNGCLHCMRLLDIDEIQSVLSGPEGKAQRDAIYGVDKVDLDVKGPSVVSINGIVASYAVTEYFLAVTGIRGPIRHTEYRGSEGKIVVNTDTPNENCYYCNTIRGQREKADVERYIRNGIGDYL